MLACTIRIAASADLDALEALEDRAFSSDALSRRSLRYYIGAPTVRFLVLERQGAVVGDAIVAFRERSLAARLYSLAIEPGQAGRGLGKMMLAACEDAARARGRTRMQLEVRSDNEAAIRMYQAAGYHRFAHYADYYEDGATAFRYAKQLIDVGSTGQPPRNA